MSQELNTPSEISAVLAIMNKWDNHAEYGMAHFIADMRAALTSAPKEQAEPVADHELPSSEVWAELHRLRVAVKGPTGYATWQAAATDERIKRVRAERALAAAQPERPQEQAEPVGGNDWAQPTTYLQRFGDALQLLCNGLRPADEVLKSWLENKGEGLQEFACANGPVWAQGIGLIDAARVMADQPTEDVDHELLATQPERPQQQAEPVAAHTAWMIEAKWYGRPLWFNGTIDHEMTDDPNAAIRFPTKAAAEFFFTLLRVERPRRFFKGDISVYEITEHQWLATQPERLGLCGGDAVENKKLLNTFAQACAFGSDEDRIKAGAAVLSRMAGADAGAVSEEAQRLGAEIKDAVYPAYMPQLHAAVERLVALATAGEPKPFTAPRIGDNAPNALAKAGEPKP